MRRSGVEVGDSALDRWGGESGASSANVKPDPALQLSATGPRVGGGEEGTSAAHCNDIRCDCVNGMIKSVEYET